MCVRVSENQKFKNGLKSFILKNKDSLPFSYVHLVKVFVHSGRCLCTFTCDSVLLSIGGCAVGYLFCTVAFYVQLVQVSVHLPLSIVHLVRCLVQLVNYTVQLLHVPVHLEE